MLASYAASDENTRGRRFSETPPINRSEHQRDRDRIIHCSAFRRLEYKTQVFVNHEGDMFRTRLTHSLEVAQVSRSVARTLQLNEDLAEAIALSHDLGHTPFGHAGQDALNQCMRPFGGFEHNIQSLRVVDQLEKRYPEYDGLNLTFETREGILKRCPRELALKFGDVGERFINPAQTGLEAQLVNVCDEIAYNTHDLDDGLRAGLLSLEQLIDELDLVKIHRDQILAAYPDIPERRLIHQIIRLIMSAQIVDITNATADAIRAAGVETIADVRAYPQTLVTFTLDMQAANTQLKRFLTKSLYHHYRVRRMTRKAKTIIEYLFSHYMGDVTLLPHHIQDTASAKKARHGEAGRARAIADYIAGMTDRYAINEYQLLSDPMKI